VGRDGKSGGGSQGTLAWYLSSGAGSGEDPTAARAAFDRQYGERRIWDGEGAGEPGRGGTGAAPAPRRRLWHDDLIAPPAVAPILAELCSSFEWGHLHPDCPPTKRGRYRLDHDNAHFIAPFSKDHEPGPADFPAVDLRGEAARYPSLCTWSPEGILQDGLHGGPPLYHLSVLYELLPVRPGDGGFGCIRGSHLADARIGPDKTSPLGQGHVPWGKPPWSPEVDRDVTRVESQPGDAVIL